MTSGCADSGDNQWLVLSHQSHPRSSSAQDQLTHPLPMSTIQEFSTVPLELHNKPSADSHRPIPIPLHFEDSDCSSEDDDTLHSPPYNYSSPPARPRHVSMSSFLPSLSVSELPPRLDELEHSAYAVQQTPYESNTDPFQAYSRIWNTQSAVSQPMSADHSHSAAIAGPFTELAPHNLDGDNNCNTYNSTSNIPAAAQSAKSSRPPYQSSLSSSNTSRSSSKPPQMTFSPYSMDMYSSTVSPKDAFLDFDDVASRGDRQSLFMSQDPRYTHSSYTKDTPFVEPRHVNPPYTPMLSSTSSSVPLSSIQAPFDLPPNAVPWELSTNVKHEEDGSDHEDRLFSGSSLPSFSSSTNSGLFNDDLEEPSSTYAPFDASFFKKRCSSKIPLSAAGSDESNSSSSTPLIDEAAIPYRHSLTQSYADAQDGRLNQPESKANDSTASADPVILPVVVDKLDMYPHAPQAHNSPPTSLTPSHVTRPLSPPREESRSVSVVSEEVPSTTRRRRTPVARNSPARNSPAESVRRRKKQSPKSSSITQHPLVERLKLEEESTDKAPLNEESEGLESELAIDNLSADESASEDQDFDLADSEEVDEDEDYLGSPWPSKRRRPRTNRGAGAGKQPDGVGATRQRISKTRRDRASRTRRGRRDSPEATGAAIQCGYLDRTTGKRCQTMFQRPYDRTRHLDTVHAAARMAEGMDGAGDGDRAGITPSRTSVPRCDECGGVFSRRDALIRHCRIRHRRNDL